MGSPNSPICFINWSQELFVEVEVMLMTLRLITDQVITNSYVYGPQQAVETVNIHPIGNSIENTLIDDIRHLIKPDNNLIIIVSNTLSQNILQKLSCLIGEIGISTIWYKPNFVQLHSIVPSITKKAKSSDLLRILYELSTEGFLVCQKWRIIKSLHKEKLKFDYEMMITKAKNKGLIKRHTFNYQKKKHTSMLSVKLVDLSPEVVLWAISLFEGLNLIPFVFRIQEILKNLYKINASLNEIEAIIYMIPGYDVSSNNYFTESKNYARSSKLVKFMSVFENGVILSRFKKIKEEIWSTMSLLSNNKSSRGLIVWSLLLNNLIRMKKKPTNLENTYEILEYEVKHNNFTIERKKLSIISKKIVLDFVDAQEALNMIIGILLEFENGIGLDPLLDIVMSLFSPRIVSLDHLGYSSFDDMLHSIDNIHLSNGLVFYKIKEKAQECPYCMDDLSEDDTVLECTHQFHRECLLLIINKSTQISCPMCRSAISKQMIENIKNPSFKQKIDPAPKKKENPPPTKINLPPQKITAKRTQETEEDWEIPGVMKCLTYGCKYMFDAGSAQKYQCPLCREEYCLMCHSKTCGCIRREMNANIGFENWMSENNIKKCPSCGIPVENETRSVTVECVMCHLSFCFTCGLSKKVCSCQ